jgi:hypothetical protein
MVCCFSQNFSSNGNSGRGCDFSSADTRYNRLSTASRKSSQHVVFQPKQLSASQLNESVRAAWTEFYSKES